MMSSALRSGSIESPATIAFAPTLISLKVERVESLTGPVTIIVRKFDRPDLCRLCPLSKAVRPCEDEGYCMVRVEGYVPDESCPGYSVPAVVFG